MTLHLSQIGFDYLASFEAYFCILLFGEGRHLAPDIEELERMLSDCFRSENGGLNVFL